MAFFFHYPFCIYPGLGHSVSPEMLVLAARVHLYPEYLSIVMRTNLCLLNGVRSPTQSTCPRGWLVSLITQCWFLQIRNSAVVLARPTLERGSACCLLVFAHRASISATMTTAYGPTEQELKWLGREAD